MIEIWFDGAVMPMNPGGHGGYGLVVRRDHQVVLLDAVYVGRWPALSNNCTEYCGAIAALRYLIREGITEATVYGDADLIINQLNGRWRAKSGAYFPYYQEAYSLRQQVPFVKFMWIPREQNGAADELSKEAVTRRPCVVGFQLDSSVPIIAPPKIPKRKRSRDMRETPLGFEASDSESYQIFLSRYGDL